MLLLSVDVECVELIVGGHVDGLVVVGVRKGVLEWLKRGSQGYKGHAELAAR